ncbi:MAG TPA: phosphopantetheine-binding protein, partial [Longimicrobiaceae bacterium]|nr:phosphopantetheine-binding protein [Longimicrobiaceae bacterium]
HNRDGGPPWTSIGWDAWGRPREPGADGARPSPERAMTPAEGIEAFRRVLAMDPVDGVVVSTGELEARIGRWVELEPVRGDAAPPAPPPRPARKASTPYAAPTGEIEERVAAVWREMLGAEQVGIHDRFLELGGHSLLGIQILSRLRRSFGVDLPADTLFRSPTVAELSSTIEGVLLAEIEQLTEEEAARMLSPGSSARDGAGRTA